MREVLSGRAKAWGGCGGPDMLLACADAGHIYNLASSSPAATQENVDCTGPPLCLPLSPASTQELLSAEGFSTNRQGVHDAFAPPGDTSLTPHGWQEPSGFAPSPVRQPDSVKT